MWNEEQSALIPAQSDPIAVDSEHLGDEFGRGTTSGNAVKVLSILQSTIGLLITMFGSLLLHYKKCKTIMSLLLGSAIGGIAGGVIIFIAGGLGIASYKDRENVWKAGSYLAFSIVSCCLSVIGITTYAIAMELVAGAGFFVFGTWGWKVCQVALAFTTGFWECDCDYHEDSMFNVTSNCNMWALEKVFTGTLLVLVIIEFIVALTAAILTCISTLCGRNGCCNNFEQEAIIYPADLEYTASTTNPQIRTSSVNPQESISQHVQSAQGNGEASTSRPSFGTTNNRYASQGPPPAYQK